MFRLIGIITVILLLVYTNLLSASLIFAGGLLSGLGYLIRF